MGSACAKDKKKENGNVEKKKKIKYDYNKKNGVVIGSNNQEVQGNGQITSKEK